MEINESIFNVKPYVKLIAYLHSEDLTPEDLIAFGARATIRREDPIILYKEVLERGILNEVRRRMLDITIGSGHISVLDQAVFTFIFRDIPRLGTLFLVSPLYLSHLQQSMRYVEPYGVYLPSEILRDKRVKSIVIKSFKLYYAMVSDGIPKEDARYILPLYTVTNIQTVGNARELTHLILMAKGRCVPKIIKMLIDMMIQEVSKIAPEVFKDRGANYNVLKYYPSPNLFTEDDHISNLASTYEYPDIKLVSYNIVFNVKREELIEALKNESEELMNLLKHNTYTFLVKMSIAALHQALRQRTWMHIVESIYHALNRLEYVIPPEIRRRGWSDKFKEIVEELYRLYHQLINEGYKKSEVIGLISHAHKIYDLIRIDEWNYVNAVPIRRCMRAQWEIRMICNDISRYISQMNPAIGQYSLPPCRVFGVCPEKRPCEYKDIFLKRKPLIS